LNEIITQIIETPLVRKIWLKAKIKRLSQFNTIVTPKTDSLQRKTKENRRKNLEMFI
jgi:hypothetical protein